MKIVITGGHHSPALAIVDELAGTGKIKSPEEIYWFGHKYSVWGDRNVSAEYEEVLERKIKFFDLHAGKIYRTFNPLKLIRLPLGLFQSLIALIRIKPELIISFGGYLAFPVVISGWILRVPIVTHEQTMVSGLANRLIALFAQKVFISWPQSAKYFPPAKTVLTGNPVRSAIFRRRDGLFFFPENRRDLRTLYVTGGKQGSHFINELVRQCLIDLLKNFNIIHQSGRVSFYNDRRNIEELVRGLPEQLKNGYILKDFFNEAEIGSVFGRADIIVSRSGANTVYEIALLGKPAILIPIPWSSQNEQKENALFLDRLGSAILLEQDALTPVKLVEACLKINSKYDSYRSGAKLARQYVRADAAENIVKEIGLMFGN